MHRWALGIPAEHLNSGDCECSYGHWAFHRSIQISNAQKIIEHSTGAFRFRKYRWTLGPSIRSINFRMLGWALDIPPEHSDFECSDGHWAFHLGIQILMLRWALDLPREHSDFKCSDGHWIFQLSIRISNSQIDSSHFTGAITFRMLRWALAFHRSIQISNAEMGIGHSPWAFRFWMLILALGIPFECSNGHYSWKFKFRMLRRGLGIPAEHSQMEWWEGHWAFYLGIQILNAQIGIGTNAQCRSVHLKFECSEWMPNAHLSVRMNAQVENQMPILAFKIWMPRWNAKCPSKHSKYKCSGGMPNAHLSIWNWNAKVESPIPIWTF